MTPLISKSSLNRGPIASLPSMSVATLLLHYFIHQLIP